jgi:hypothetical protein
MIRFAETIGAQYGFSTIRLTDFSEAARNLARDRPNRPAKAAPIRR